MTRLMVVMCAVLAGASCAVGPNYARPRVEVPEAYRDVAAGTPAASLDSLADVAWFDLFKDETLTNVVNTALRQNFDVRTAAERVIQAREQFRIVGAERFPAVDATAGLSSSRVSEVGATRLPAGVDPQVTAGRAGFSLAWELDVWGRVRRLNESARAQYLATEEARRGIVSTLVADVSQTYLALRAFDAQLETARRSRDIAVDNLRLTELRRDRGVVTTLDVRQAEQFLYTTTAQIAGLERAVAETEHALSLLLGQPPGDIGRGRSLDALPTPPEVPVGLPSSLLERRPDIRQAEQELIAANAEIGVARAAYFPRIGLTGLLGLESRALADFLTGSARTWSVGASAVGPIFNAGRTRATVKLAESVQRELVINYQRAIYSALREVADALAAYRKTAEQRVQQESLVAALRDTVRLSTQRYEGGIDSYLQVLVAQRSLFESELDLTALRREELGALIELYRALGGGWQIEP